MSDKPCFNKPDPSRHKSLRDTAKVLNLSRRRINLDNLRLVYMQANRNGRLVYCRATDENGVLGYTDGFNFLEFNQDSEHLPEGIRVLDPDTIFYGTDSYVLAKYVDIDTLYTLGYGILWGTTLIRVPVNEINNYTGSVNNMHTGRDTGRESSLGSYHNLIYVSTKNQGILDDSGNLVPRDYRSLSKYLDFAITQKNVHTIRSLWCYLRDRYFDRLFCDVPIEVHMELQDDYPVIEKSRVHVRDDARRVPWLHIQNVEESIQELGSKYIGDASRGRDKSIIPHAILILRALSTNDRGEIADEYTRFRRNADDGTLPDYTTDRLLADMHAYNEALVAVYNRLAAVAATLPIIALKNKSKVPMQGTMGNAMRHVCDTPVLQLSCLNGELQSIDLYIPNCFFENAYSYAFTEYVVDSAKFSMHIMLILLVYCLSLLDSRNSVTRDVSSRLFDILANPDVANRWGKTVKSVLKLITTGYSKDDTTYCSESFVEVHVICACCNHEMTPDWSTPSCRDVVLLPRLGLTSRYVCPVCGQAQSYTLPGYWEA